MLSPPSNRPMPSKATQRANLRLYKQDRRRSGGFTDARAHVTADTYDAETTASESSRKEKLQALGEYKQKEQFTVDLPEKKGQKLSFNELEELYNGLKDQKAKLIAQLGELMKPVKEAQEKRDTYMTDHLVSLTPEQIDGLRKKVAETDPTITQINVAQANIVDRCESCHAGIREPLTLTPASMSNGKKPDMYARAFVSHPEPRRC